MIPTPKCRHQAAFQAEQDVARLAEDVAELDPTDVWAAVASWRPERIVSALVIAAACVDPDRSVREQAYRAVEPKVA